jgi:hypothetical protein
LVLGLGLLLNEKLAAGVVLKLKLALLFVVFGKVDAEFPKVLLLLKLNALGFDPNALLVGLVDVEFPENENALEFELEGLGVVVLLLLKENVEPPLIDGVLFPKENPVVVGFVIVLEPKLLDPKLNPLVEFGVVVVVVVVGVVVFVVVVLVPKGEFPKDNED